MHIRFGTMARLFLTNITPKSEKADIDVEHEPEHARDKENVDDVKNLEKDVEDATTEVKPEQELDMKQEEGEMDPKIWRLQRKTMKNNMRNPAKLMMWKRTKGPRQRQVIHLTTNQTKLTPLTMMPRTQTKNQ